MQIRLNQIKLKAVCTFAVNGCVQQKKLLCNCCKIRDWYMLLDSVKIKSIHQSGSRINFTTVAKQLFLLNAANVYSDSFCTHTVHRETREGGGEEREHLRPGKRLR